MSILTENRPSPLQQSLESDHSTYSVSDYGDEDVAYYSDASTRSSDTFDHKDYIAAVDPLENSHKTRFEDNIGCVIHVRTDDELDDDTSGSDSDFEPAQPYLPQEQQQQQERQLPNSTATPKPPAQHTANEDDSDSSSVYSNESEYLDNEPYHVDSTDQPTELQRTSQEMEYHDQIPSLDNSRHSATPSTPINNTNTSCSSASTVDDSFDDVPNLMDRSQSAHTGTTTPTLDDELDHKFDTDILTRPTATEDDYYSAVNLENLAHEPQPSHLSNSSNNRSTLRLSTVSASDLNEISLSEEPVTTLTAKSTTNGTNTSTISQAATSAISVTKPSVKSPTSSPSDSPVAAATIMSPSLPPLPPKDRSIKPTPIDTAAPPPTASSSSTTTPTMTPSRSSTTQRFVSGLWSPFKTSSSSSSSSATTATATNAKKVVRPSANFTKRQSRPPSCALPGFQESLLLQMEQLNSDNGNDPKAQRLLNLKRQTIRQSLVLASSGGAPGAAEQSNKDEYDWEFWTSVICDFDQVQKTKTLPSQVEKGVPPPLRGMVWQLLAKSQASGEQYMDLLRTSNPAYDKMIQRDLARTFPTHPYFKDKGGVGQEGLFNVVRAYSVYDTEVAYCQGLAFIVGPLLLNMPDEEAFGVLIRLMSHYGLRGHFTPNMEGLHLRLYQFECLVADHLPHIFRHLKRLGIDTTMYASQWFMTLFAYKFPIDLVFRIYDMVFAQGLDVVLKFALALLKRNETHILQLDFDQLVDFLKTGLFEKYKDDDNQLVHDTNEWDIPRRRLVQLEKEHKAQLTKDEQDAQLLTTLQEQQATLQQTVDQLTQSTASTQKEQQDVADQLQDSQHQRQQLQDEQASLKTVVESLRTETAALPSKVEARFKTEFDTLCNENARLNEKNAQLEDQLSATEALLIDIKMRYAQSEDERDDLSKRLFELKKIIAQ